MAAITKRVRKDGRVSWGVRVRVVGCPTQVQTFRTKLEAQRWAVDTEAAAKQRSFFVATKATLGDVLDRFEPKAKPSTAKLLPYWRKHVGAVRLRDISPFLIDQHRDRLLGALTRSFRQKSTRPRSSATVRTYLSALSRTFTFAIQELHWIDANPVANVKKPAPSQWRKRFLLDDERERLLNECKGNPHLYAAVLLSITTGLRAGEMYQLTWSDISFPERWATLWKTKNGEVRGIPLTQPVIAALEGIRGDSKGDDKAFPFDLTKQWRAALARAEIQGFRWHDLRHSAASYLAKSGVNTLSIASLLGHKTLAMTRRYSHLANEHTRSIVDQVMEDVR